MAAKLLGQIGPGSTSEVQWRPKKLLPFSNVLNAILTYDRKLYLVKLKFYFIYNEIEHGKKSVQNGVFKGSRDILVYTVSHNRLTLFLRPSSSQTLLSFPSNMGFVGEFNVLIYAIRIMTL